MGAQNCADGFGWRECNGVAGNGWGKEAAGDEPAWLRGRRRTGKIGAENCTDGMGARGRLEMGEEKKPLVRSERGCADGGGREKLVRRTARTAADGVLQRSGWKWLKRRSRW